MKKLSSDQLNIALNSKSYLKDYALAKQIAYTLGIRFVGVKKDALMESIENYHKENPNTGMDDEPKQKKKATKKSTPKKQEVEVETVPLNTLKPEQKFRYKNSKVIREVLEVQGENGTPTRIRIKNTETKKENNIKAERELEYPVVVV